MTPIKRGTAQRLGLRHDPWHAYPRRWVLNSALADDAHASGNWTIGQTPGRVWWT